MTILSTYQIVGYKNRGKTNLVCRLIDYWTARGYRVATIKHDAHEFEFDRRGSDTWLHRHSGASWSAITASNGTAIVHNQTQSLAQLIKAAPSDSIVIVEGFKHESYSKLVLVASAEDLALAEQLKGVTAAALWPEMWDDMELRTRLAEFKGVPVFELDDTDGIARHIEEVVPAAFRVGKID